jgi:hypothetical protein
MKTSIDCSLSLRLAVSSFALCMSLLACTQESGPQPDHAAEKITDGVYTFRFGDQRSLFLVADQGVIVTDPLNAVAAAAYRDAIAEITDQPVRYVVYSHYHWDRISGAQLFKDAGAEIVAQERCADRFRANPNPDVVMPDITFSEEYSITVGDKSLDLFYFGPSHGDCLTVFVANPANLLQVVELVNPPRASFPRNPLVSYIRPHNLRRFFLDLEFLANERGIETVIASSAIPVDDGRGGQQLSAATGPASIITDQARFWEAIYNAVDIAEAEGNVGIDSFVKIKTIDLEPFKPYDGYNKEDLPIIMRRFVGFYDMGR